MKYELTSEFPLPGRAVPGVRDKGFPFLKMKIGESFFVPIEEDTPHNVGAAAARFRKTRPELKFTTRRNRSGTRVWRVT